MSEYSQTFVRLARTMANALTAFADDMEVQALYSTATGEEAEVEVPVGRGQRQQAILGLEALAGEEGLKTADIASAIDYEATNTHGTLQALDRAGLVELVPNASPQRWRLAPRYRTTSSVFGRIASRLRDGEWTTYGDISIAVRGDVKAARGVGQAAAKLSDFPRPAQILMEGGRINPQWRDAEGRGPEECRKRLEQVGVRFADDGHADPAQRVTWDVLRQRDQEEPVAE